MTSQGSQHLPAPEGQEKWLHRLPRPEVTFDRLTWLASAVQGDAVAHLGFADTGCELTRQKEGRWLHAELAKTTSRLVGLDIVSSAIDAAMREGFEVYRADCTRPADLRALNLDPFDAVVAGELIEHVSNPGGMLEAASELLGAKGRLILTTPNARRLMDSFLVLRGREIVHPDHVTIFSLRTLVSLLTRYGWTVDQTVVYMNPRPDRPARTFKERILRCGYEIERAFVQTTSPLLADGLIVVARRHGPSATLA